MVLSTWFAVNPAKNSALSAPATPQEALDIGYGVFDAVASQHAVKSQDQHRRNPSEPAYYLIFFTQGFVSRDNAFAALPSQGQLGQHYNNAYEYNEGQVYYEKCNSAVVSHFVRKAPEVAQSHGRAYGRHEKAEPAPPLAFLIAMFNLNYPSCFRTVPV